MAKATTTKASKAPKSTKTQVTPEKKKGTVKVSKTAAAKLAKGNVKNSKTGSRSAPKKVTKEPNVTKEPKTTKATRNIPKAVKRDKYGPPNNNTERINCYLNVNIARRFLRDYISNTLSYEFGTINAQYPYAALTELLFLELVRSTAEFNKKNQGKADLYEVTYLNCRSAVLTTNTFPSLVRELARDYDPTRAMGYVNTIYDNARLRDFISQKTFTNKNNYNVEEPALNFLCYIVNSLMCEVVRTACFMIEFSGHKNVGIKAFIASCKQHFTGDLGALVEQRMSEITEEFYGARVDDDDEDAGEETEDDGENADEEAGDDDTDVDDDDGSSGEESEDDEVDYDSDEESD